MEIDRRMIKTLASETKVNILKSLGYRKKMTAELSAELKLSPSTVSEHIKELESADMVRKIETGHKWVYYELTPKSLEILKPKAPVQSIFLLAVGVVAVLVSGLSMIARDSYAAFGTMQEKMIAASSSQREVTGISVSINDVLTLLLVIGAFLIVLGVWKLRKSRSL